MNLPTWGDCFAAVSQGKTLNALEQFVYDNEPAGEDAEAMFRTQLMAALAHVVAQTPRRKRDVQSVSNAIADQRPDWAGTSKAATASGKSFRGTGRFVINPETGDRQEIGTWINPAGDVEAARLTKETGIPHVVDPKTGDVVSIADVPANAVHVAEPATETVPLPPGGEGVKPV